MKISDGFNSPPHQNHAAARVHMWQQKPNLRDHNDQAERHDLKLRPWLFFSLFLFPPKKEGRIKGEGIAKIVNLSHAFLLDQFICSL